MRPTTRRALLLTSTTAAAILACTADRSTERSAASAPADGLAAFAIVQKVLQHPRCQNCHVPDDAPRQFDDARVHGQNVLRGPEGRGPAGLACTTCHGNANSPPSYGDHAPPGAPRWQMPPPDQKMVFIDVPAGELARNLKDPGKNGGRDLDALLEHVQRDPLVLWGWHPGTGRAPVDVPHAQFVAAVKQWIDAGAPVPAP